jgi:hypothetical protein
MDNNSEAQAARDYGIWRRSPEGQADANRVLQIEAMDAYDPASGVSEEDWVRMYMANKGQNNTRNWSQPPQALMKAGPLSRAPLAQMVARPDASGGLVQVGPFNSGNARPVKFNDALDSYYDEVNNKVNLVY